MLDLFSGQRQPWRLSLELISVGFLAPESGSKTLVYGFEHISQSHLYGDNHVFFHADYIAARFGLKNEALNSCCPKNQPTIPGISPGIPPSLAEALIKGLMKAILDKFHLGPIQLTVAGILFLQAA